MITLGLNYSQMHDSSACLVRDGELLFAVAEERISRVKHDSRFPTLAIQACFDFAKITAAQVDEVCVGWQAPGATFRQDLSLSPTGPPGLFPSLFFFFFPPPPPLPSPPHPRRG